MRKWKKEAKFEIQMHGKETIERALKYTSMRVQCACMWCVSARTVPSYAHSNQSTMCWLISKMEVGIFSIFTLQTWFCHHEPEKREQTAIYFLKCRKLKQHKSVSFEVLSVPQCNQTNTISNPLFSKKEKIISFCLSNKLWDSIWDLFNVRRHHSDSINSLST